MEGYNTEVMTCDKVKEFVDEVFESLLSRLSNEKKQFYFLFSLTAVLRMSEKKL